jgi:exopolysaccharide production protein ExoY
MEYFCTTNNTRLKQSRTSVLPFWKRATDLACCILALPLLIVCALVMTVVTKIASPGPVIFRQERVGHQGRRFKIYKFRSMHVNVDPKKHERHFKNLVGTNAPMVKLDTQGDAWLIPGGWILRASGLDELPQIINVLRGEMSIIGPRPCLPSEAELYQPWQRERFNALPGLTGLWQVSGKNQTTFDEMVRLDIRYAQNRSWLLDLKILTLTVPALFVQIYETKIGRRLSSISAHTAAPFAMAQNRVPMKTR